MADSLNIETNLTEKSFFSYPLKQGHTCTLVEVEKTFKKLIIN